MEVKIFVGYRYGRFTDPKTGEIIDYCNAYFLEDFEGNITNDCQFDGMAAVKYKVTSCDVFKDIQVNSKVYVYFDSKRRVTRIEVI